MGSIMDRRLRRAPDAEWVLMYRLGLSRTTHRCPRARSARRRRIPPGHRPPPGPGTGGRTPGRRRRRTRSLPLPHGPRPHGRGHRLGLGRRPAARRPFRRPGRTVDGAVAVRCAGAKQPKAPSTRPTATVLPGCPGGPKTAGKSADEARWHHRLAQLVAFREEGNDWPRHQDYDSEREHTLGVWIHTQRYKRRRGELDPVKLKLLDDAVPGWQAGRTRGRPPRR